jgi:hypothetical protein
MDVFNKIEQHWMRHGFMLRVVTDEDPKGKTIEELDKMYFQMGVGDDLTALPFVDFLVVMELITNVAKNRFPMKDNKDGTHTRQVEIKTAFTEAEAFACLNDVSRKVGIEVKPHEKSKD